MISIKANLKSIVADNALLQRSRSKAIAMIIIAKHIMKKCIMRNLFSFDLSEETAEIFSILIKWAKVILLVETFDDVYYILPCWGVVVSVGHKVGVVQQKNI